MQRNIFSPRLNNDETDPLSNSFNRVAQIILAVWFVFLPVVIVPGVAVELGYVKSMIVAVGLYIVLILVCLAWLRHGRIKLSLPLPILVFWGFLGVAIASALVSNDAFDAIYGAALDIHSVSFLLLFAFVMSLATLLGQVKTLIIRFLLGAAAVLLLVYLVTIGRLIGGPEWLSFGVLTNIFVTPLGSLNDLALYAGLALVLLISVIDRVPANIITRTFVALTTVLSLIILAVVNFSFVWIVLTGVSLTVFLYLIARDNWLKHEAALEVSAPTTRFSLLIVAGICLIAGAFVVSGDYLGGKVNEFTQLNYVEVRPSHSATLEVGMAVYAENALLGIGPNRFEDAWRLYKNPAINETQFWNTSFTSGSSYVFTTFITTGVAGALFLIGFLVLLFFYLGRQLFVVSWLDRGWQQIGIITIIATAYLWLALFFYTPGPVILLLTAFFSGLALAIVFKQRPATPCVIDVTRNRQQGFVLIAGAVIIIILATVVIIYLSQKFLAQVKIIDGMSAFAETGDVVAYDAVLAEASNAFNHQDLFVAERARLRLADLTRLTALSEPTENDRIQFEQSLLEGVRFAEEAIAIDPTNPFNHALLGSLFGLIDPSSLPEARERRDAALAEARRLDPLNPDYHLLLAQIASRFGDTTTARTELAASLALKRDFTEALFLSSQLDIQEGNATSAIATTESIILIEPNNPGRHFQLGLLRLSTNELALAATAFERALALDPNYANARYMLALTYLDQGRQEEALTHLRLVAATNQDNQGLQTLIAQVEGGDLSRPETPTGLPVEEFDVQRTGEQMTIPDSPDTPLISPVNRPPRSGEEAVIDTNNTSPSPEAEPTTVIENN